MLRGILLFVLGIGIVAAGVVGYQLYANANATPAGGSDANARNQFLSDRGGAATAITGTNGTGGQGGGFAGGGRPGVAGTVESVAGDTLTVKSAADNTTVTVHLAANAPIRKQVNGQASDIKAGDQISPLAIKTATSLPRLWSRSAERAALAAASGDSAGKAVALTPAARRGPASAGAGPWPQRQRHSLPAGTGGHRHTGCRSAGPHQRQRHPLPARPGDTGGWWGLPLQRGGGHGDSGQRHNDHRPGTERHQCDAGTGREYPDRVQQTIALTDVKAGDTVLATGTKNGDIFEATALQVGVMQIPGAPTATP